LRKKLIFEDMNCEIPVLRHSNSMPVIDASEEKLLPAPCKVTKRLMRIDNTDARSVFNMALPVENLLIAGSAGLCGNVPFDLRT
jgi:hypothetical protein